MSGYSGTPLARKLGIEPGNKIGVLAGPDHFGDLLVPYPAGANVQPEPEQACDVLVVFAEDLKTLEKRFRTAVRLLGRAGGLWLAWPKKSSGVETDLDFESVQGIGLGADLVDNKVCAIDETWSALRFVVRKENRADWPRFNR